MRFPHPSRQSLHALLAALLALAILGVQWAGFAHRIAHAGLSQQDSSWINVHAKDGVDKSIEHSCLLFDSTTLAASLPTPPYIPALLPGARMLALWSAFASWDAPLLCHFSSRAPPRA